MTESKKHQALESRIKSHRTAMLIGMFKGLESNNTPEADLVNDIVMNELENRLTEAEFETLLDEVYAD